MQKTICLLPGDGIGPEIVAEAVKVLRAVEKKFGHSFTMTEALLGGAAIDAVGVPLPDATVEACKAADAVFLGAVGGPKWDTIDPAIRPERGLLGIRKALGLFANLRPATLFPELAGACLLRPDISAKGLDLIVVRELTGGIYFGERGRGQSEGGEYAYDTEKYNVEEITRIAKIAFELAQKRKKKVISIDKANVLESSRLWREIVHTVAKDYPDVEVTDMLVDNAAMQLVKNPAQFDVVVTSNIFGPLRRSGDDHGQHRNARLLFARRDQARTVRTHSRQRARHCGQRPRQPHRDHSFGGDDAARQFRFG